MTDLLAHLSGLAPLPTADFAEFGDTETVALSKIQRLTGGFLSRNWVAVPHVTHHDNIDVTDAERRRKAWNTAHPNAKLTPVILLISALASVLPAFPQFNASLTPDGKSLVLKKYINIGVAVDTPKGLVVPVLRDAQRAATILATELAALADQAKAKGLSMAQMSGGSITVSSLGHIGGTAFTPIINLPEVAILGATAIRPHATPGTDGAVVWRMMLPLSLSYDHRVVNGADAARFVRAIGTALQNLELA